MTPRTCLKLAASATISLGILFLISHWLLHPSHAQNTDSGTNAPQTAPTPCPTCGGDEDKPHTLAASYYSVRDGLTATLMLNNKGPKPLEVNPTLFSLDGQSFELAPVIVEGTSFREIDMRDFGIAGTAFEEGSLQLFHRGKDLVLGAQVKLTDLQHSLIFEEKLLEISTEIGAQRLEGLWWLPSRRTSVRLILSNTSDASVLATIRIDGTAPKQKEPFTITLAPHETRVLDASRDITGKRDGTLKTIGGITVEHSSPAGSLLARVIVEDKEAGYSSSMRFFDPRKAKSTKLQGAGIRLGEIAGEELTPVIVARNVGGAATKISGRVPYTTRDGGTGVVTLPDLRLAPGEVKLIDSKALTRGQAARADVAASLEFEYAGSPGSVVMSAQSMTRSGDHAFQVPLWDIVAQRSSTGGYPWSIDGDSSTRVYIKNVTDKRQKYVLHIKAAGGDFTYTPGVQFVEPGQTVTLDVRRLRDEQIPDESGNQLPLDATSGQIHWSVRSTDRLPLIGRSEQVDIAHGLSSSYACQNCCGDGFADGWLEPGSIFGSIGGSGGFRAREEYNSCYGGTVVGNASVNIWRAIDPAVVSMSATGYATATASYVGMGETQVEAEWTAFYTFNIGQVPEYPECASTEETVTREAPVEVRPRITSLEPARGLVGNTVSVTINGSGFRAGATVQPGAGITATVQNITSTKITADFNISVDAAGGNRAVTARVGNQTSNSQNFFVQIPSKLVRANVTAAPNGIGPLLTPVYADVKNLAGQVVAQGVCGVYRNYAFHLVDQADERILQPFTYTETFSSYTGPFGQPTGNTKTVPAGLTASDTQGFGFTNRCLGPADNEAFRQGFFVTIGSTKFNLSTVFEISRGNYSGTLTVNSRVITP